MERGAVFYALIAGGAVLLWLIFRARQPSRRGWVALLAVAAACALGFAVAFELWRG